MGYHKFKLSNMIPNAWFYKFKDFNNQPQTNTLSTTTTTKKHRHAPPPVPPSTTAKTTTQPRKSYHFTRDLPLPPPGDPPLYPPRKSKTPSKSRKPTTKNTATATAAAKEQQFSLSSSGPNHCSGLQSYRRSRTPETQANAENAPPKAAGHFDIVIDFDDNYEYNTLERRGSNFKPGQSLSTKPCKSNNGFDFQLPRIITKQKQLTPRRHSGNSLSGVRLRIHSPRITGVIKQGQNGKNSGRKNTKKKTKLSESFAVVKSSDDPHRDFKESMVEMIVENNLRASKDLEDLLACYLLLNSDEYHDVIIKAFKQIWCDFSRLIRVRGHK